MPGAPGTEAISHRMVGKRVVHLVFDMPGRSMNVFSTQRSRNSAVCRLAPQSDVAGVVIRSGSPRHFAPALIWPSWKPVRHGHGGADSRNATASRSIISSG